MLGAVGVARCAGETVSDHDSVTDAVPSSLPAAMDLIDEYMHRVLRGKEDPVGVIEELKGALTEGHLGEDVGNVAGLYSICADLSDIVDRYPFDYNDGTEMIAEREIRDAAWDWLTSPRSTVGIKNYIDHWTARIRTLPTRDGGRPFRGPSDALT